jgi:hypothetical protein
MADTFVVKCSDTKKICYAADGAGAFGYSDSILRKLQTEINRFASKAGFAPLVVDGLIGDNTVLAVQKIAAIGETTTFPITDVRATWTPWKTTTREKIANAGAALVNSLNSLGNVVGVPAAAAVAKSTPPAPSPSFTPPPAPSFPTDVAFDPSTAGGNAKKSPRWPYYVAGGVGALALIYAVYAFVVPPKAKAVSAAPKALPAPAVPAATAAVPVSGARYRSRRGKSPRKRASGSR